jgi:hypothetical protein
MDLDLDPDRLIWRDLRGWGRVVVVVHVVAIHILECQCRRMGMGFVAVVVVARGCPRMVVGEAAAVGPVEGDHSTLRTLVRMDTDGASTSKEWVCGVVNSSYK